MCISDYMLLFMRNSFRVILELYLGKSVEVVENAVKSVDENSGSYVRWAQRLCRTHYRLAHYTDSLYRSYEDRLVSSEWQAALRLRQHKVNCSCQACPKLVAFGDCHTPCYIVVLCEYCKYLTSMSFGSLGSLRR